MKAAVVNVGSISDIKKVWSNRVDKNMNSKTKYWQIKILESSFRYMLIHA